MARRREMKSVLCGFFGTFASRYSDHDGYWIFGFVISRLTSRTIDLLADDLAPTDPDFLLTPLARARFREQVEKHRLALSMLRCAELELRRLGPFGRPAVDFSITDGYELTMTLRVATDLGKAYGRWVTIFVAPHDPACEHQSRRATHS